MQILAICFSNSIIDSIFYKKNLGFHSKLKTIKNISYKPQKLIIIYQQNFYYI